MANKTFAELSTTQLKLFLGPTSVPETQMITPFQLFDYLSICVTYFSKWLYFMHIKSSAKKNNLGNSIIRIFFVSLHFQNN